MCLTGSEGKIFVSTIMIFFICILPLLEAYFLLIMFPFIFILLWSLFPPILIYADYTNPPFFSIVVVSRDFANMSEYLCLGLPCLVSSGRAFLLLKEMVERHKKTLRLWGAFICVTAVFITVVKGFCELYVCHKKWRGNGCIHHHNLLHTYSTLTWSRFTPN